MAPSFRAQAQLFLPAFAVHVAEEAPAFTAWAKRNASARYSQRNFVRNNALGFVGSAAATAAVTRNDSRAVQLAYYTLVVTQQAVFRAVAALAAPGSSGEHHTGLDELLVEVAHLRRPCRSADPGRARACAGPLRWLERVVRGHCRYYAVPGNIKAVTLFHDQAQRHWFKALRRRSQRTDLDWERMGRLADRWLSPTRILHPWPEQRFHATTQARSPVR